jgi:hypothetical protein
MHHQSNKHSMKHGQLLTVITALALTCSAPNQLPAADDSAAKPAQATVVGGPATAKQIDAKADRLLAAIKLDDPAKVARAKAIMREWFVAMGNWHQQHDAQLDELWSQWSKARAASPNDEFPGEVMAQKIHGVYASLQPAYNSFTNQLAGNLAPEQMDALKENWSHKPGMTRTYKAYLQIVPDLTDTQKQVIYEQLLAAREDAMLTDSDREIVNLYKCHKLKVQAYIGKLEWDKLYRDFVHRTKTR